MSRLLSLFLVFLLIAALFVHFPSVRAEESETDSEIEIENDSASSASSSSSEGVTDSGSDSPIEDGAEIELEEPVSGVHYNNDLTTRVYFPTSAEKKFFQGEEVVLLVGVSNHGSKPYNLSAVAARLRSPYDFSIVQNYSAVWVNSALEAGKEMTVAYKFKPYEGLDPLEFPVEAFLFYNNTETGDMFQSTLFNSTITIVERDATFNPQTFFTYVLFIGLAGFGVYSLLPASATKKRSKKGVAEQAAVEWTVDDYKPATKSKVARRSRK